MHTEMVIAHHLQNFGVDLDEIMKDYVEESVMITAIGPVAGLAAIRAFYAAIPAEMQAVLKVTNQTVCGDFAAVYWTAEPLFQMGSDGFTIRDGKIVAQFVSTYPSLVK